MMQLIPTLQNGLDVNVFFTRGAFGFDRTDALTLFQLTQVPIMHGWLADPSDRELFSALDGLSFNSAQIAQVDPNIPEARRVLIQAWLESSEQLTIHGLRQIYAELPKLPPVFQGSDDRLGVLFCNNHFSAVCFHGGRLYALVTDEGFASRSAVWELIQNTTGDSRFFREDFSPYGQYAQPAASAQTVAAAAPAPAPSKPPVVKSHDYDRVHKDPYASFYSDSSSSSQPAPSSASSQPYGSQSQMSDEALARQLSEMERQEQRRAREQEDADLAMALKLQQEEEANAAAAQRRAQPQRRAPQGYYYQQPPQGYYYQPPAYGYYQPPPPQEPCSIQ